MSISMKQLLEAGVHFGHQTKRWNPKMRPYIFGARNGIHIIDLQKTVEYFKTAFAFVKEIGKQGGVVLMVGTKKQAQEVIAEEAKRVGLPYVNERWLGGMLTNFKTVKNSIEKMKEIERLEEEGLLFKLPKKEQIKLLKKKEKLKSYLDGIRNMEDLPDALFVVDSKKEKIAVSEAKRLGIPVIGIVDTNCDPDDVDYIIPGNDDAIRAVKLLASRIADAYEEGKRERETMEQKEETYEETMIKSEGNKTNEEISVETKEEIE
ncbi:MAG: 30S ribosomal protein S2 [Proteobacteria bacterium]|nr:30S ribosomal protein S2 [Pseudomonadota bacterium]